MLLYNGRHAKSEKVGCWWVTSRSGWLLELLTELINIDNFQNNHFHSAQKKTFFDFEKVKKLPKVQAGGGGIWLEPK